MGNAMVEFFSAPARAASEHAQLHGGGVRLEHDCGLPEVRRCLPLAHGVNHLGPPFALRLSLSSHRPPHALGQDDVLDLDDRDLDAQGAVTLSITCWSIWFTGRVWSAGRPAWSGPARCAELSGQSAACRTGSRRSTAPT